MICLSKDSQDTDSNDKIRDSLNDIVQKLDQTKGSSASWDSSIHSDPEKWEELKRQISEKQRELKRLVEAKKAGILGSTEFEKQYTQIQDELTRLEFEIYNMRLGTNVEM